MYFGKRWTLLPIGSKNALRLRELDDVVPVFHNWGIEKVILGKLLCAVYLFRRSSDSRCVNLMTTALAHYEMVKYHGL